MIFSFFLLLYIVQLFHTFLCFSNEEISSQSTIKGNASTSFKWHWLVAKAFNSKCFVQSFSIFIFSTFSAVTAINVVKFHIFFVSTNHDANDAQNEEALQIKHWTSCYPNWKPGRERERDWMSCKCSLLSRDLLQSCCCNTNPAISWEIAVRGWKIGVGAERRRNWVKLSAALHSAAPSTEVWSDQHLPFIKMLICRSQTETLFFTCANIS